MRNTLFSNHIQYKIHIKYLCEHSLSLSLKGTIVVAFFPPIKGLLPTSVDHILRLEVDQLLISLVKFCIAKTFFFCFFDIV